MKIIFKVLSILILTTTSCEKLDVPNDTPNCIKKKIRNENDECLSVVYQYETDIGTVYVFEYAQCLVLTYEYFNDDCDMICKSTDIDANCEESLFDEIHSISTIWDL